MQHRKYPNISKLNCYRIKVILSKPWSSIGLAGKLSYSTMTRPDILYSVGAVSQFLSNLRTSHWNAFMRIFHYLNDAPGKGLLNSDGSHNGVARY